MYVCHRLPRSLYYSSPWTKSEVAGSGITREPCLPLKAALTSSWGQNGQVPGRPPRNAASGEKSPDDTTSPAPPASAQPHGGLRRSARRAVGSDWLPAGMGFPRLRPCRARARPAQPAGGARVRVPPPYRSSSLKHESARPAC